MPLLYLKYISILWKGTKSEIMTIIKGKKIKLLNLTCTFDIHLMQCCTKTKIAAKHRLHQKHADRQVYLFAKSEHSRSLKHLYFLYWQALRRKTVCSTTTENDEMCKM